MIVIMRLAIEMNNDGDDNSDRDNDGDNECNQCLVKLSHGGTAMSDDKSINQ